MSTQSSPTFKLKLLSVKSNVFFTTQGHFLQIHVTFDNQGLTLSHVSMPLSLKGVHNIGIIGSFCDARWQQTYQVNSLFSVNVRKLLDLGWKHRKMYIGPKNWWRSPCQSRDPSRRFWQRYPFRWRSSTSKTAWSWWNHLKVQGSRFILFPQYQKTKNNIKQQSQENITTMKNIRFTT